MKILILVVFVVSLFAGCSSVPKKSVTDAVESLQKIDSATKVNPSFQNYNSLIIDARSKVDLALPDINNQELKTEFENTIQAYSEAGNVWKEIGNPEDDYNRLFIPERNKPSAKLLLEKYKMPEIRQEPIYRNEKGEETSATFRKKEVLPTMWKYAKEHLDKVVALSKN